MADIATIKINGKDARTTWGLEILSISGYSPLPRPRHNYQARTILSSQSTPESLALSGYLLQDDQDDVQAAVEALASEFGIYGGGYKQAIVEIVPLTSSHTAGDSAKYIVAYNGRFDVRDISSSGRAISESVLIEIGLDILGYIHPDGIVERSSSAIASSYFNYYFEDADCLQGADKVKMMLAASGSVYPTIVSLATGKEFEKLYTGYDAGTPVYGVGPFGNPALSFLLAGSNTLYFPVLYALPIMGGGADMTILIRFKWSGTPNANTKYLLCTEEGTPVLRIFINTSSGYATVIADGDDLPVSGCTFSSSGWNTLVVRLTKGVGKKIFVKTPTQNTLNASDAACSLTVTGSYFYLGTYPSGTGRCDCSIGEVAVWKYPLSDAACQAAAESNIPIRENPEHELNRRLTFYLDFANGITAMSNRMHGFNSADRLSSGGYCMLDCDRKTISSIKGAFTGGNNPVNAIAMMSPLGINGRVDWPMIERYNNLIIGYGAYGKQLSVFYNPLRRA